MQNKKLKEEAPAMSVAGGVSPALTNPQDTYSLMRNRLKDKYNKRILRRRKPL